MGLVPTGAGVATIGVSKCFIGGIRLLTLGILGDYAGRIFDEVKARLVAVVTEVVDEDGHQAI